MSDPKDIHDDSAAALLKVIANSSSFREERKRLEILLEKIKAGWCPTRIWLNGKWEYK